MATQDSTKNTSKEQFYRYFQLETIALQDQLSKLPSLPVTGSERSNGLDRCLARIAQFQKAVQDASSYIPAYDQKTYSEGVKELFEEFGQIRASLQPKPKFAFKKSIKSNYSVISRTNAANSASEQTMESEILNNVPLQAETRNARPSDTTSIPNGSIDRITEPHRSSIPGGHLNSLETESQSASTDTYRSADIHKISTASTFSTSIFSQKAVQLIIPSSTSHTTASSSLIDLQDCLIDMVTSTLTGNYFATLVIKNVQQCLLLCGAVSGAVHITSAERSVIVVTARQFRMHDCRDCIVYLHANGQPIIENCHRVQFAPIPITFDPKAEDFLSGPNQWDQVQDFNWLKAEHSPNWDTLAEHKRLDDERWTRVTSTNPDLSLEERLRIAGVRNL